MTLLPTLSDARAAFRGTSVVLWVVAVIWLVCLAVPVLADSVQVVDDQVWDLAVAAEQPALVLGAKILDVVGGTVATTVLAVLVGVILAWQRRGPALVLWLGVMVVSQVSNAFIKLAYERPRPPLSLVTEHTWSFVSGHALTAAVVGITLVLIWIPAGPRRRWLLLVASAYAIVMAASRVYLRVHWLSDTLAGLAIGGAFAVTGFALACWWEARTNA